MPRHTTPKSSNATNKSAGARARTGLASVPEDPVDRLLATDLVLIRLGNEIRKYQRLLRGACSDEAWKVYLRIEELMNEKMYSFADNWVEKHPQSKVYHGHQMSSL